jgi:Escherichia/Staphylococcus phage prohead protease
VSESPGLSHLRSLAEAQQGRSDVIARFEHGTVLGRVSNHTLRLREDGHGLRYEIDLPDTTAGRDLLELIRRGDIRSSSFAFKAVREKWRDDKVGLLRELLDVRLIDVSPVVTPAYQQTSVKVLPTGQAATMAMRLDLASHI